MDAVANLAVDMLNQKELLPGMADIREPLNQNNLAVNMSASYDEGNSSSNSSSESNEEKGQLQSYDKKGDDDKKTKKRKRAPKATPETTEARRESHKIIEQKRRQKINEKINELRELLNYPDGTQNKAVVLQAAVDNIRNLKVLCAKLLASHRQLQEDYVQVVHENERLKKIIPPSLRPPGTAAVPNTLQHANFPSPISKPPNANPATSQGQPSQTPSLFNELRSSGSSGVPEWSFVYDENQQGSPANSQLIQQYQQAMAQRGGNPAMFQQPTTLTNTASSPMQNLTQSQPGTFSLFSPSSTASTGGSNLGYSSIEALARTLFNEGSLPLPVANQAPSQSQQPNPNATGPTSPANLQGSDQFESHQ